MAALVAAAACSDVTELAAGPTDRYYFPTGAAVTDDGTLLVASSNFDLRFDQDTGGSVIAVDPSAEPAPDLARLLGAVNVASLSGQIAVADPAAGCDALPDPSAAVAIVPARGPDLVYRLRVAPGGAVSCADCAVPVGSATRADPFAVGIACGPGIARAYVGYLRSDLGEAVLTQLDLTRDPAEEGAVQHVFYGSDKGQVRGFAYDRDRERLYVAHTVRSDKTSIRWIDLGGGCNLVGANACANGETKAGAVPPGVEVRGIALSHSDVPFRRVYLTVRIYDPALAAAAGFRNTEFDGRLVVADLVETLGGELDLAIVRELDIGYGAADVVVLPERPGRPDLVAALAADSGRVTIYDDETGSVVGIGADLAGTGAPLVGHAPVALAVDPNPLPDNKARLYVPSFQESFVSAIDVPLDDPERACLVAPGGGCATGAADVRRIRGGVAQ